jgi:SOS response regulatory protein OraA/RecX
MTHDELTTRLREPLTMIRTDAQSTMFDAADRLDRYRYLLEMALEHLSRNWPSVDDLRDTIREEIK